MARPEIMGWDYFPFDVGFFRDKKVKLLKGQHDSEGIEIYQRLLCKCYEDNGYYLHWDDEDDVYLLADETGCSSDKVRLVVSTLLRRSLLTSILALRGNVLTSRGIQRRYFEGIRQSKEKAAAQGRHTFIDEDICLLEDDDLCDLNKNRTWLFIRKNDPNSTNNDSKSENNSSKSTNNPPKVKESKVKESKEKERESIAPAHEFLFKNLSSLLQQYCITFYDRLQAKIDSGKLNIAGELETIMAGLKWTKDEYIQFLKHLGKTYFCKPAFNHLDIKWALSNVGKVMDAPEDYIPPVGIKNQLGQMQAVEDTGVKVLTPYHQIPKGVYFRQDIAERYYKEQNIIVNGFELINGKMCIAKGWYADEDNCVRRKEE